MIKSSAHTLDDLVRASSLLSREHEFRPLVSVLVDQAIDITRADLAALYAYGDPTEPRGDLKLIYRRGNVDAPRTLSARAESVEFVAECKEALVLLKRDLPFFGDLFLHDSMNSAIALPLFTPKARLGLLVCNSRSEQFWYREKFSFLDSFTRTAAGVLNNARLYEEVREQYRTVDALERYQESIFTSMTDLLVTTDEDGTIHYFNRAAGERLGLTEDDIGVSLEKRFTKSLRKVVRRQLNETLSKGKEILGLEGIFDRGDGETIDFSLNASPLRGRRGRNEGMIILFTDQSRERMLKQEMDLVVEERRVVKDMFARYLSSEVVDSLMESPELVKPGGDKKTATIFFGDIRGYTSFSETKQPEYIIEVLNEYFREAVEIIIKYRGYIDKFIGDAIMAAWGVPMMSEEEDAIAAVSCAVEIQQLISSEKRTFFRGEASKLRVGIGMHTGPLVAGNLGSDRRMDYSVIGDTVNVAARLEGVAKAGQVVITDSTRNLIGDTFKLKELEPVKVKGKEKPLKIFNVLERVA